MRAPRRTLGSIALIASIIGFATAALAAEGVIEINQAAATAGGIVPGDSPGFPVTISTGTLGIETASYKLTGTLSFSGAGNAIEISGDNVTLDLNGFTIKCTLPGPSGQCTGHGVSSAGNNITVRNGTVELMEDGISLTGASARVERVRAYKNHRFGIRVGPDGTVVDSIANDNGNIGIFASTGCLIQGNVANNNGQSTLNTSADGIDTNSGCNVTGNTVRNNRGRGLDLFTATGYSNNVIHDNVTGTVSNGVPTGHNVCNGLTTCP